MDSLHSTMNQHIKGKHLSFEERVIIQLRLKDGYSLRAIARELNCSPSTISYEVKRGTVELYHGKVKRYKATQGHDAYQAHRKNCGRKSDFLRKTQFMRYVHKHFFKDGWSLDVCSTIMSMCDEFFSPADRAILKESVPSKKDLNSLISKLSMIDQVVNIAGTALSGVLLSLLIAGQSMLVCSYLSLISIFFLYIALRKIPSTKPQANDTDDKTNNYRAKVFSGLKYIRQNRFLKYYFWSCICYSFVSPALIILLPKLADKLGSAGLYSTFYLCFVGGFLLGALISGKLTPTVKTISYTWMLSTIPLLMMIFFLSNWLALSVLIALFGFLTSFQNILSESMIQITTEDAYLGRVLTTIRTSTSIGGLMLLGSCLTIQVTKF